MCSTRRNSDLASSSRPSRQTNVFRDNAMAASSGDFGERQRNEDNNKIENSPNDLFLHLYHSPVLGKYHGEGAKGIALSYTRGASLEDNKPSLVKYRDRLEKSQRVLGLLALYIVTFSLESQPTFPLRNVRTNLRYTSTGISTEQGRSAMIKKSVSSISSNKNRSINWGFLSFRNL